MNDYDFAPGCFALLILLAIGIGLAMVWGAVAIGAANSWVFGGNFTDGWHQAWGKPWILLGWSLLFVGSAGSSNWARRD